MTRRAAPLALALAAALAAAPAAAQHGAAAAPADRGTRPPREASQYDFLLGEWELTVTPKAVGLAQRMHGVPRLRGSWKAWRALDGWGVEDEMRVVDESGNPVSLTHSVRLYDPATASWRISTADAYRQTIVAAAARWTGREMAGRTRGADAEGKAYLSRTRLWDVSADGFRYRVDRSYDDGKSWDEGVLEVRARRVAAAASR